MARVHRTFFLLTLAAILLNSLGCASSNHAVQSKLQPVTFGEEQTALFPIRSTLKFAPSETDNAEAGSAEYGTMTVRDHEIGVRRLDGMIAVDSNLNHSFDDEASIPASGKPTTHTVRFDNETVEIVINAKPTGRAEYAVCELWQTPLRYGNESITIGVLRLGTGMAFIDTDADGTFETYWDKKTPKALGGRFWTLDLDYTARRASLMPSEQEPVEAGYQSPSIQATRLDSDQQVIVPHQNKVTLLLFCHKDCYGCRVSADTFETLSSRFAQNDQVRLVSVNRSDEEAAGCKAIVCPNFEHVVSAQSWDQFGVTPTPTFILVDADGTIRYRSSGAHNGLASELSQKIHTALQD
ncbi:MAG: hypothetical protein H6815_10325 [Phycisphaeraceae bacterium]|nr:hypothetical protein [Phycisphaerales bacterium]MCB9860835.1 hypothetical protein [Phycisphaeraceae bacterium]